MVALTRLILAVAGLSSAGAFTVPRQTTGANPVCDASCQGRQAMVAAWELDQRASANTSFYDVPASFNSKLPAGKVLKVEEVTDLTNYTVPGPLSLSRILYTTADVNGTIIPASAYILWPATEEKYQKKAKTFPIVAWAHGTTGGQGPCAPSNYRGLQYHFMVPFTLAMQGYVVVAPDYAGLGVSKLPNGQKIAHPWVFGSSQANDLANAIIAARAAFPQYLSKKGPFVAMGHSQGGGAVWSFAEKQVDHPLEGYKGAISIAPPTDILAGLEADPNNPGFASLQAPIIAGITAVFPSYNLSGLTDFAATRWRTVLESVGGCFPSSALLYADVTPEQISKPAWYNEPIPKAWRKLNTLGGKKFRGPLLIIAGSADHVVALSGPGGVEPAFDNTCSLVKKGLRESLELSVYTDMDHFPVVQGSHLEWTKWIEDHISEDCSTKKQCTKKVVTGFRTESSLGPPFPNFYMSASLADSWKGLL